VVVPQPDERHANRAASLLEWYDRHRAYNIWFKRRKRSRYYEHVPVNTEADITNTCP